jgi:hypothetical protein
MGRAIPACLLACCFAVTVAAQDTTVKSQQKIKSDDGKVVTLRGCLAGTPPTFTLDHASSAVVAQSDQKSDDVARNDADRDHDAVGTTGSASSYLLMPREGVALEPQLGHMVEVTGVLVPAGDHGDVDLKVKDKTKVEREDAPDSKVESKTKADIDKGSRPQLAVTSVKVLAPMCIS